MSTVPSPALPSRADAELNLSLERAHRETFVLDRLHALWALLLAKCCLLQAAIERWNLPIDGWIYVWACSLTLACFASFLYLRAHREDLRVVPVNSRVATALLAGLAVLLLGATYASLALGLLGPAALGAAALGLAGLHGLVHAALRRRPEPLLGALVCWGAAWSCLHSVDLSSALAWCGGGLLLGASLPAFALARASRLRVA